MNFNNLEGYIFLDGELVEWAKAKLHVLSHGLHYASSVFEGERVYNGKIFKEDQHTNRLILSARTLGFELPYNIKEISEIRKKGSKSKQYLRWVYKASGLERKRDDGNICSKK